MRLLMFRDGAGRRLGALRPGGADEVVDLTALAAAAGVEQPPADLLALVDEGDAGLGRVAALLDRPEVAAAARTLAGVEVLAPLDPPWGNVLAIGRNYARHAEEAARAR